MDSDTSTRVLGTYQLLRVINKVGVANVGVAKLRFSPIPHHVLCFERQEVVSLCVQLGPFIVMFFRGGRSRQAGSLAS